MASREERAEALHRELAEILRNNPLESYNNPLLNPKKVHKKQLEFHAIQCPPLGVKAAIAANRSGKTFACVADDVIQLCDEDAVPEHLRQYKKFQPPISIWVGAPKFSNHEESTLPLFRKIVPKSQLTEGSFDKSFRKQPNPTLKLVNGSSVGFKTYDQDRDAWAGAAVHRIHWDEEPNTPNADELRSEARGRLVSTGGDEIIGMTPLLGYSWVYTEVWLRQDEPKISVIQMRMEDNPWNSKEAIEEFSRNLSEDEKRMRLRGEFVHIGGLVYPELSDTHFVPHEDISAEHVRSQEVIVGIDPGVRTTAAIFVAFDKDNTALVFDELYLHNESTIPENAAASIRSKLEFWGVKPRYFMIDPSARNRSLTDGQRVQRLYQLAGVKAVAAQNDVETGVFEIKRRLEQKLLLVSDACRQLKKELRFYRVDPKADESFAVIKQDDHGADALRYVCMARPTRPASPKRREAPKRQDWIPGTAPPLRPRPAPVGPFGRFA